MDRKPNYETTAIWVMLNRAHKRLNARIEKDLRRSGLPPLAWYDVLWGVEKSGGIRQNELEKIALSDQSSLSRSIKKMVEQGYLVQETSSEDRRSRFLKITDSGSELRARMWEIYGALMLSEIEEILPSDHASNLEAALRFLVPDSHELEAKYDPKPKVD